MMDKVNYETPRVKLWQFDMKAPLLSLSNPAKSGSAQVQNADDGGYYGDVF